MLNDVVTRNALVPLILRLALAAIFTFHGWHKIMDSQNEWGALWANAINQQSSLVPADVQARLEQYDRMHPPKEGADPLNEQVKSAYDKLANQDLGKSPEVRTLQLSSGAQLLVAWGEFLGGIALLVGLLTRLAALGLVIIQVGAIALVTGAHGFSPATGAGYEYNIALVGMCLVLILTGGGAWSLDRLIWRRRQVTTVPAPAPTPAATA